MRQAMPARKSVDPGDSAGIARRHARSEDHRTSTAARTNADIRTKRSARQLAQFS